MCEFSSILVVVRLEHIEGSHEACLPSSIAISKQLFRPHPINCLAGSNARTLRAPRARLYLPLRRIRKIIRCTLHTKVVTQTKSKVVKDQRGKDLKGKSRQLEDLKKLKRAFMILLCSVKRERITIENGNKVKKTE